MICPNCKFIVPEDAKFCSNCRTPLNAASGVDGVLSMKQKRQAVRCNYGHYYDASQYQTCPHCAAAGVSDTVENAASVIPQPLEPVVEKKGLLNSLFGKKDKKSKKEKKAVTVMPEKPKSAPVKTVAIAGFDEEEPTYAEAQIPTPVTPEIPSTAQKAIQRHTVERNDLQDASKAIQKEVSAVVPEATIPQAVSAIPQEVSPEQPVIPEIQKVPQQSVAAEQSFCQEAVQKPVQKPVQKSSGQSALSKTVSIYCDENETEPVVGWLVGVKGHYVGQSFQLISGKNLIGRSPEVDIYLAEEESVSRHTHAIVIYDPKSRKFLLQAGDTKGLTYRNNSLIMEHEELKPYDRIQLGMGPCEMLFIPLCSEKFSWDEEA